MRLALRCHLSVIVGSCLTTNAPLAPLRGLLRYIVECVQEAPQHFILNKTEASVLVPYEASLSLFESEDPLPHLPPEAARSRLFETLTTVLQRIAVKKPIVLILDDTQWADELTLRFLEFIAYANFPVLVVASYRSEDAPPLLLGLSTYQRILELHLRLAQGNRTHAAKSLGITREGLRKKMKRFHLE